MALYNTVNIVTVKQLYEVARASSIIYIFIYKEVEIQRVICPREQC